jgi:medium-chain acyl-[acyl-carrier-protein] hydrolase
MTPSTAFDAWIILPKPNPQARLRLFCFSYAGGGASVFHPWPDLLPPEIEIYAIQFPGREGRLRESPFTRLLPLVQTLTQVLRPYLNPPFAFFGHSLGALVGFELARHLRRQRESEPLHLFVSGHRAPQMPDPDPPIHQLPESAFIAELRRLNGTPEEVLQNKELMELMIPLLRADFAIHETYVYTPEAPLVCPISAFGGLQDDKVSRDNLVAWRDQTDGAFTLRMFPGDHFFLHSAQIQLLQAVSRDLTLLLYRLTRERSMLYG